MQGYLSLVLHAHLPFVRHPEHEKFLEEEWLFEAVTETYLPLLEVLEGWRRDGMDTRLTLCLSPTLCAMLRDPLLQDRYVRHLNGLIELAEKEVHRTYWDRAYHGLALFYHERFQRLRDRYFNYGRDLVGAFAGFQNAGTLEIITTAATHGLLPLLAGHPPSIRGQILTARDHYRECFGRNPRGIWLPECAYVDREAAPALRRVRTHLYAERARGLRARSRFRQAGLEQTRGLSRRRALPRLLPRHRLRPRLRLRAPASRDGQRADFHRHQVSRHHRRRGRKARL
jgi:hypothetical protein